MGKQIYTISPHNSTTTFNGLIFTLPSDAEYDLTGAQARIDFIKKGSSQVALRMNSLNNTLQFILPYQVVIPESKINLVKGVYEWDLRIIFSDGRHKTFIGGEWSIDDVITD